MPELIVFETPLTLGQKARILRFSKLLTQAKLAEIAGVTQQDVSLLERNRSLDRVVKERILESLGLLLGETQ